jgi:IK cytokine
VAAAGVKGAVVGGAAAMAAKPAEADVDDIFGDGVGSDYICAPTDKQAKEAEIERRLATQRGGQGNTGGGGEGAMQEGMEGVGREGDVGAMSEGDEGGDEGDEATKLLHDALARGAAGAGGAGATPGRDRAGEGGMGGNGGEVLKGKAWGGEAAKSKAKAGEGGTAKEKEQGVSMGGVMDDSYAECFPDSFERYNMELGPDSDDENSIVRSGHKEEAGEEEQQVVATGKGEKGKGGKKRPLDKEKVEAQKAEARMDRDLVQIEKLMVERSQKKARGESLALGPSAKGTKATPRGGEVDQNEMF